MLTCPHRHLSPFPPPFFLNAGKEGFGYGSKHSIDLYRLVSHLERKKKTTLASRNAGGAQDRGAVKAAAGKKGWDGKRKVKRELLPWKHYHVYRCIYDSLCKENRKCVEFCKYE
jgi:hypothetical protein